MQGVGEGSEILLHVGAVAGRGFGGVQIEPICCSIWSETLNQVIFQGSVSAAGHDGFLLVPVLHFTRSWGMECGIESEKLSAVQAKRSQCKSLGAGEVQLSPCLQTLLKTPPTPPRITSSWQMVKTQTRRCFTPLPKGFNDCLGKVSPLPIQAHPEDEHQLQ